MRYRGRYFGIVHYFWLEESVSEQTSPAVAIVPIPSGQGYYLVFADGGVFSYGDAHFWGSMAGQELNAPIVDAAVTESGEGYWLLGADGGVFAFGNAGFFGTVA